MTYYGGYHWHLENNIKKNEVILVEGEKSVMNLESHGIDNAVAIGTSHISKDQMRILMKLKTNIVLALDNDKKTELDKNFLNLAKYNKCYAIIDDIGYLGAKDAPIDKGIEIFKELYDERKLIV